MLRLGQEREELNVVNDQKGAPTSALALATATRRIVDTVDERGIKRCHRIISHDLRGRNNLVWFRAIHLPKAQGDKSWASIAGIPASEYPTPAMRPANSVLSNKKLKRPSSLSCLHGKSLWMRHSGPSMPTGSNFVVEF